MVASPFRLSFRWLWIMSFVVGLAAACGSSSGPNAAQLQAAATPTPAGRSLTPGGFIKISETVLRKTARNAPIPVYPKASVDRKIAGVVVLQVLTTPDGKVSVVDVLQAPSHDIGAAAVEAVRQWTFSPMRVDGTTDNRRVKSLLTFYFSLDGGNPKVLDPAEAPMNSGAPAQTGQPTTDIAAGDLESLRRHGDVQVLDVRERDAYVHGHVQGAINIPLGEVATRAVVELHTNGLTVIACGHDTFLCTGGAQILRSLSFKHVAVLSGQ